MKRVTLALASLVAAFPLASAVAADIPAIADTNTDTAAPNNNLGSNGIVAVSNARVGLIRFDQAAVAGAAGNTAALKIRVLVTKNAGNAVAVRLVTSAWNEKTVTARTLPSISGSSLDQKTLTSADVGKTVTFDVSAAVAAWKSNPSSNFGLALVAATPAPNVSLGSREGGSPALLSISGTVTADNDVTVSTTGGDYPTLDAAANNAEAGDKWCVGPTDTKPCTIHMTAGIHKLANGATFDQPMQILGEERGETIIISTAANTSAITFAAKGRLADLTLTSPSQALLVIAGITLERVVIRARSLMDLSGGFTIVDSDLTAIGDGEVLAVNLNSYGGTNNVTRSRLTAISRNGAAQMFDGGDSGGVPVNNFTDSSLTVWGKGSALLFNSTDEFAGLMTLLRTQVDVSSPGNANGFDGEGFGGLHVLDSHINVHGGTAGSGIYWDGGPVIVDNSTIDATTNAVEIDQVAFSSGGRGEVTVMRSQLHSAGITLALPNANAHVESSVITGTTAVRIAENASLTASTSQLAGAITKEAGATASCDHVYDANLALRPATCVSP